MWGEILEKPRPNFGSDFNKNCEILSQHRDFCIFLAKNKLRAQKSIILGAPGMGVRKTLHSWLSYPHTIWSIDGMVGVRKTVGYRFVVVFGTFTLQSPSLCMFLRV